jgi:hypothetical protein
MRFSVQISLNLDKIEVLRIFFEGESIYSHEEMTEATNSLDGIMQIDMTKKCLRGQHCIYILYTPTQEYNIIILCMRFLYKCFERPRTNPPMAHQDVQRHQDAHN